ncbi:hypothetical protein GLOIN_2v1481885 [Rhizophagus irregularis DAOM 181602=DAOM 197198]|uniref:Uncharacterized protein n=1 Tax=Rhizophagus irregularis (strain DAOM 181602 / DAOM 197198 / MUCL 43194) TaxID=747089 RepID=A0A2P4PNT1_RHIID|nr:hypothetical protein GLOIN_2v1481885 [Rhizophagus irregularis DAOM 181602=DAOM 197198]POG67027.1 hypothetical protein GLOIN_2v1481885 [Rhizophagus irregularis DAOM 181602=DAOM 197198]GBC35934.2 hypothetical protein GLOIN_2v1481885 [Rhizophagus irregularis DAOM 181602=DAOM 197198]|eukprot:XP_025173893.1 hypothetical protein GLOIN_2v1481885 [Rhizophagus irregularis DAOM 181602=DAOM 197198]
MLASKILGKRSGGQKDSGEYTKKGMKAVNSELIRHFEPHPQQSKGLWKAGLRIWVTNSALRASSGNQKDHKRRNCTSGSPTRHFVPHPAIKWASPNLQLTTTSNVTGSNLKGQQMDHTLDLKYGNQKGHRVEKQTYALLSDQTVTDQ